MSKKAGLTPCFEVEGSISEEVASNGVTRIRYGRTMFDPTSIPIAFLARAADLLGHTSSGLSGRAIVTAFLRYGEHWDVRVPYPETLDGVNKRNGILESLKAFAGQQQFIIIDELAEHDSFAVGAPSKTERAKLRHDLHWKHGAFKTDTLAKELDLPLVEETRHWLERYPGALGLFDQAKTKYDLGGLGRNVLDDLRLALEKLLHAVLGNEKSLENQLPLLASYLRRKAHRRSSSTCSTSCCATIATFRTTT
jgi:hypothetical protein